MSRKIIVPMMFNFNAPFTDKTSYGLVALNLATRLNCRLFPIGQPSGNLPKSVMENLQLDTEIDLTLPTVRLFHQFDLQCIGRSKKIGYTIFELDKFNKVEKAHLKSMDEIWVCTEWAKTIIESNNIHVPTKIVHLGVDLSIFHPVDYVPSDYVFLSAGKWEVRKSQNEIVEAFNRAFKPSDGVQLWLSMHNGFMAPTDLHSQKQTYLNTTMGKAGKIKFVGPFDKQDGIARIMNMSSCGVFPSKAEGWGLETLEMMACGKPVIVTNYAGHTEFCNDSNSVLLQPDKETVPAYDGKWFFKQGNWCSFNIDDLIESMRKQYKLGNIINTNGIETSKKFSWESAAQTIEDLIK